jgi:hypothetical protein
MVTSEPPPDAACYNYSFDIGDQQSIVSHLFKEVWNRELILSRTFLRMISMMPVLITVFGCKHPLRH